MLILRRPAIVLLLTLPAIAILALSCGGGGGGGKSGDDDKGFRVIETSPRDAELAVALDRTVEFTFSEEIDATSLTDATAWLEDEDDERVLLGTLTLEADRRTAGFVPAAPFSLDTRYRLTVTTEVLTRAGDPLRKEFDAWFHTVVTPPGGGAVGRRPPPRASWPWAPWPKADRITRPPGCPRGRSSSPADSATRPT